jgi:hypothetical protein
MGRLMIGLNCNNLTGASIDLSGYYLSDRPNANPLMFQIPNGTPIHWNGYLII